MQFGRAVGESGRPRRAVASVWIDGDVRAAKDNILVDQSEAKNARQRGLKRWILGGKVPH